MLKINKERHEYKEWISHLDKIINSDDFERSTVARILKEDIIEDYKTEYPNIDYSLTTNDLDQLISVVINDLHEQNVDSDLDIWTDDSIEYELRWRFEDLVDVLPETDDYKKINEFIKLLGLTENQVDWLRHYANNQHPGADGNKMTRFPTVHYVYDYTLIESRDGERFSIYDFSECGYSSELRRETDEEIIRFGEEHGVDVDINKIEHKYYIKQRVTKAIFLTYKAACDYMEYQKHNLSSFAHVYTDYVGYANNGDIEPLCRALLKLGLFLNNEDPNKYDNTF